MRTTRWGCSQEVLIFRSCSCTSPRSDLDLTSRRLDISSQVSFGALVTEVDSSSYLGVVALLNVGPTLGRCYVKSMLTLTVLAASSCNDESA